MNSKAKNRLRPKHKYFALSIILVLLYLFAYPLNDFDDPTSTVLISKEGKLLGAKIAHDEQWRFEESDSLPQKFELCICTFEDKHFHQHFGINPISIARALFLNIKAKKIVSGGSTITMQTIRLLRKGKSRTVHEKLIEALLALRLEVKYSKSEILNKYASHAPFGGNVVGLEAASWRYYGRCPFQLSWAETACLAVLPNAPALIYPGKNSQQLKAKRDRLLKELYELGHIDKTSYLLSLDEALPKYPKNLPQLSPHLLDLSEKEHYGEKTLSTIDYNKQTELKRLLNYHSQILSKNEIHNAAAIIVNNETGHIEAYTGNSDYTRKHSNSVDVIQAPRSSGSILKPFLYAALLNEGDILPTTLIPDVPLFFDGFSPENYHLGYDGAVAANEALSRSLNIPFVFLLKDFGTDRFHHVLNQLGLSTITKSADHYGLTLILGGAEVKLIDLVNAYSYMARTLDHCSNNGYKYYYSDKDRINYIPQDKETNKAYSPTPLTFSAGAIWETFEAMRELNRPDNQTGWKSFASAKNIAWKTGTSFGFRDAWAIGVSKNYTVGIWVGNADGEGRPGLTGVRAAAPLLFDVFDILETGEWFKEPYDDFSTARICQSSGHLASRHCEHCDTAYVLSSCLSSKPCPYHSIIHLDSTLRFRVDQECSNPLNIIHKSWFILPPNMAYFYKKAHPDYTPPPPKSKDCLPFSNNVMQFIYPQNISKIFIPKGFDGQEEDIIFEVNHRERGAVLYWHLDNEYLGQTSSIHQFALCPTDGFHTITVVDDKGNSISTRLLFKR